MPDNISSNFSWAEVTHSETAARNNIDNTPPTVVYSALYNTAAHMELVRVLLQTPILVSSWYRSPQLNSLLKSSSQSQHVKGEAVDFISPKFGTPTAIVKYIEDNFQMIQFDQLILEHSWVHVSFNSVPGSRQRGQVLSLLETGHYAAGITDSKGNPL